MISGREAPEDLEAFLASEQRRSRRLEWLDGRVQPRPRHSTEEARIAANIYLGLRARLRTKSRRDVHRGGLEVVARRGRAVLYPDVFVRCGPLVEPEIPVEDPAVVFEIGRAAAEGPRRIEAYQSIASLWTIVQIAEAPAQLLVVQRQRNGWREVTLKGLGAVLELPEIRVELPLVEIYEAAAVLG